MYDTKMPASTLRPCCTSKWYPPYASEMYRYAFSSSHWPTPGLASLRGVVVANRPMHVQDAAPHVVHVEVAADADLLFLHFAGPEALGRTDERVVDRVVEALHEVRVESHLRREERRVERDLLVAR